MKPKFGKADYPIKYLDSVINHFLTPKNNNSFVIPADLFEDSKPFSFGGNTILQKKIKTRIKRRTRKVKSLFKVKNKNPNSSYMMHRVNAHVEKNILERQKEIWKNLGVNIATQQEKLNKQDSCQVISVTCYVRTSDAFTIKDKNT